MSDDNLEELAIIYPFSINDIEDVYKCVGKDRKRTIEVIEEALRKAVHPLDVPGVAIGIVFKHKQ